MRERVCVCAGESMPDSYHDGGDHDCAVLHASRVVWKQRRVLDQHQFVCVVPVADLQGKQTMGLCTCSRVRVRNDSFMLYLGIPSFLTLMQSLVFVVCF